MSFSQDSIAQKIGISRPTYLQIEKGERDVTVPEASKLAEIFGMSLHNFLDEKNPTEVTIDAKKKNEIQNVHEYRISVPQERVDKFKEVLLYIIREIGAKPNVGEAVLCKLLYFVDFDFYEKFEDQLIGAKYIKNHFGPTPVEFLHIVKKMESDGDLVKVSTKYFDFDQKKYLPLRDPDLSILKIDELEVINSVIARLGSKTAAEMRDYSHGDVPWLTAEDGKAIDYESVFYRTPAYSVRSYADELPKHA
jgi:transcriptional regulator with XRE-family HTH domain